METHHRHNTDPFLTIPPLPRRPQQRDSTGWNALQEASLVGLLALSASWALAELVTALSGF